MHQAHTNAPVPDLRIVATDSLHAHEEHDSQRSAPLINNIGRAEFLVNPPIVAPMDDDRYVILDGANRCFAFQYLGYPHILAQVVTYESGYVALDVWHHIISQWTIDEFFKGIRELKGVQLVAETKAGLLAHILLPDNSSVAIQAKVTTLSDRNALLRQVVNLYQRQAVLDRTAISEPHQIFPLYPKAMALVVFPKYEPADIIAAATHQAYLPPGISRHIIQGRAIQVNFPVEVLRDTTASLEHKNQALRDWIQRKFASRQVRYYAEATYQFNE
jgi:hypothetical protein